MSAALTSDEEGSQKRKPNEETKSVSDHAVVCEDDGLGEVERSKTIEGRIGETEGDNKGKSNSSGENVNNQFESFQRDTNENNQLESSLTDKSNGNDYLKDGSKDEYNALIKSFSSSSLSSVSDKNTEDSSSSESSSKNNQKEKPTKLEDQLKEAINRLEKQATVSDNLKKRLIEETDAKEYVESDLAELQEKYKEQLKNEEDLQMKYNNKKNYCDTLEKRLIELNEKLPKEVDADESSDNENSGNKDTVAKLKQKYENKINDLKATIVSNEVLIETHLSQIGKLDIENTLLKEKMAELDLSPGFDELQSGSTEHSKLLYKNTMLEKKLKSVEQNCDNYMNHYKEAIVALKEIKEAYCDQRDEVFEKFKEENKSLKEQLENLKSHKEPSEDIVTSLRQDILDSRLALERNRKIHQDKLKEGQKKIQVSKENLKNTAECLEEKSIEVAKLKTNLENKQDILRATEDLSNQRMQIISELKLEVVALKDNIKLLTGTISTKNDEISDLHKQIMQQSQILTQEHEEKKRSQQELEIMETLKEANQNLIEEIDELKTNMKTKKMKVKFLKKQLQEFEDQKERFEKIVFVVPEMQKKIDQLEEEKETMREKLTNQIQKEQERVVQLEQQKKDKEDRIQRERENWERRLLGIGQCELIHDEEANRGNNMEISASYNRPRSAPLMKPRPPSARRYITSNSHRRIQTNPSFTLNPSYLNSSLEGRRASEKIRDGQQRVIVNDKNKRFRSATQQMNNLNSFSNLGMSTEEFFPKVHSKKQNRRTTDNNNASPRVLVWGEQDEDNGSSGKKLVAVGDRVMANILRDCSLHGRNNVEWTGLVKFIGFVKGNDKDVYIGLRMDEEVGNTDGCVEGTRYFRCEMNRGKFVRLVDVVKVVETRTMHKPVP